LISTNEKTVALYEVTLGPAHQVHQLRKDKVVQGALINGRDCQLAT